MKINPIQMLPLALLRPNPANPKRAFGNRYLRGLRASLARFGFAGLFVVAGPDEDGTYEVLDGNTRLDELDASGVKEVPCVVLDLDPDERIEFSLSHDRNRKLFDEDAVVAQLKELAGRGRDLAKLSTLTAQENLRHLVGESAARSKAAQEASRSSQNKVAAQKSLTLYGPSEDINAITELTKRIRGRMPAVVKLRQALEQAEQFQDVTDQQFLIALCSALKRIAEADGE